MFYFNVLMIGNILLINGIRTPIDTPNLIEFFDGNIEIERPSVSYKIESIYHKNGILARIPTTILGIIYVKHSKLLLKLLQFISSLQFSSLQIHMF